jgi:hypothetical protein
MRQRYRKKADQPVTAVQLNLDVEGFSYAKWGTLQHCKRGDWVVDNNGEVYTVDRDTFARTYRRLRPGAYLKIAPVWAEAAEKTGAVKTKEGISHYERGDYLVSNNEDGTDAYCIAAKTFEAMYECDDPQD